MNLATDEQIRRFCGAARAVCEHGLVRCSSGNLSWRIDEEHMLVSASKSWLGELTAGQVSVCRVEDGAPLEGPRPSIESRFHAGILRHRPDRDVVLHFQAPAATAVCCRADAEEMNFNAIIEIPCYLGPVACVRYLPPGTEELAHAVVEALKASEMALLANHGQVTVGTDFHDAVQKAAFFELACEVLCRVPPDALKGLSDEQARRLHELAQA
jgi:ribulose-5-phosphate 4-epimerase/fuculose-1-phosphate aldolase